MKCPSCSNNHKVKDGMKCSSCGYVFALNPKEEPKLSDVGLKSVIDKLSGTKMDVGLDEERRQYYFTRNQLYSQLYRLAKKKQATGRLGSVIVFLVFLVVVSLIVLAGLGIWWLPVVLIVVGIVGGVIIWTRPVKVNHEAIEQAVKKYESAHPIQGLVDGTHFKDLDAGGLDPEILDYAPERMLIVQRDDMADMLLLNRFYFEHKTLVVSANKYPARAFEAFQRFLESNPDIPIHLLHDASREGLLLNDKLINDKSWNLKGKDLQDLGLFAHDVDRLKDPVWIPESSRRGATSGHNPIGKKAQENVAARFSMPVDAAPPAAMMGGLGLAMIAGMALLSNELLAHQEQYDRSGASSGGYG